MARDVQTTSTRVLSNMHVNSYFCVTSLLSLVAGCSETPDVASIAEEHEHVSMSRWVASPPARTVVVLVVDDTQDPDGTAMRESLAAVAHLQDQPVTPTTDACPGSLSDALVYHPMDVRFAVIHPSAAPSERLITPNEVSALARSGEINDPPAYSQWQSAIQTAIHTTTAGNGTYALIESVEDTLMLLTGQRSARTEQERKQLASLALPADSSSPDSASALIVNIATAHDDGGALAISGYADPARWLFNETTNPPFIELQLAAAGIEPNLYSTVTQFATDYPRLATWLRSTATNQWIPIVEYSSLFDHKRGELKTVGPCMSMPPRTLADGSAACRVHSWLAASDTCDVARGRLDPLVDGVTRGAKFTSAYGSTYRVCELRQFEAANLSACLDDVALPNPEPGWCFPVPSRKCNNNCPTSRPIGQNFRFVRGIDSPSTGGMFEITCELPE